MISIELNQTQYKNALVQEEKVLSDHFYQELNEALQLNQKTMGKGKTIYNLH